MFNYTQCANDLIKAMTHKYIRRVPKGVTKTGKTKYIYFYAGQETPRKKGGNNEVVDHVNSLLVSRQARGDKNHFEHLVDSLKKVRDTLNKVNAGNIDKKALRDAVNHIMPDARAAALNRLSMSSNSVDKIRSQINVDALVNTVMGGKMKNDIFNMIKEQIAQKTPTDVIETKTLDYMQNRVQDLIKRAANAPTQESKTTNVDQEYQRALDQTANPDHVDTIVAVLSRKLKDGESVTAQSVSNTMLSNVVSQIVPDIKSGLVNRFRADLTQRQIDPASIKTKDIVQKVIGDEGVLNKIKETLVDGVNNDKDVESIQYQVFQHIANAAQKHITTLLQK